MIRQGKAAASAGHTLEEHHKSISLVDRDLPVPLILRRDGGGIAAVDAMRACNLYRAC